MMNHTELNELVTAYEVDVRFTDVSGMEHLNMLLNRSALAEAERHHLLTVEQRARLAEADRILATQAVRFYLAIQRIADLETWRQQEQAPPEQWWWYLDVVAQLPVSANADLTVSAA